MKFTEKKKIILAVVALIFSVSDVRAVGQAAIPTILLAPGARATALGEAYVGLSDDVDAIFYNPGALGLQPMSNAWKIYQLENGLKFSILAGKKKLLFGEKASLWASTSDNTLHKFDGSQWLSYEVFFLEQNYNIAKVVKKYLGMEDTLSAQDSLFLDAAVKRVRKYNDIELPEDEENIPDFRIPFSVVLSGRTIISMAVDPSNRLWVSTDIGLYTYASGRWKLYATGKDGLPNALVKSIYAGSSDVWVATDSGAAKFSKGEWTIQKTAEFTGTDAVNTIMIDDGDAVWIGTTNGLVRRKGKSVTIYDSTNGLVDNDVRAFALDAERNVWAATKNGLSRYRLKAWKKFRMDGNEVFSVTADTRDYIWLSTKKGALRYYKGALETKDGKSEIVGAYWKHFHAKNGLPSDKVSMIIPQGRDVWVLTDKGIGRFDKAEKQVAAFYENLLPEFALPDLYHLNLSGTYPTEDWGTLGAFVKYISFGTSKWTDELGKELGEFNSYDMFIGVSYGTSFGNNLGVGISPKFIYSKLSDVPVGNEKRKGISYSYAVDFGLKYRDVVKNLDFGLALQ
ncbi:MAG: hypothetical protein JNL74_02615, partial [Fibrobacteres bacterium]|nr:hypothetical protein [Fibrobacterota bacterium]